MLNLFFCGKIINIQVKGVYKKGHVFEIPDRARSSKTENFWRFAKVAYFSANVEISCSAGRNVGCTMYNCDVHTALLMYMFRKIMIYNLNWAWKS
jgi:hypothetical protein